MSRIDEATCANRPERRLTGTPVCAGIGIGPVFGPSEVHTEIARRTLEPGEAEAELNRFDEAVSKSRRQVVKLRARLASLPESSQAEIAPLLDAYVQMLGPSRLVRGARRRIAEGLMSAEAAVADEVEAIAVAMLAVPTTVGSTAEDAARRADEVREIGRRVVRNLSGAAFRSLSALPDGVLLVVESLRPADVVLLDPNRLAGVATEVGSVDGHTGIMLRALGVPAVLGIGGLLAAARPGDQVALNGTAGTVVICPGEETLAEARRDAAAEQRDRQRLGRLRGLKAETLDGEAVELQANLELPAELTQVVAAGAAGIGLLRSEFLFMTGDSLPDEDAQTAAYAGVVGGMAGQTVTVRVLDWGNEKGGDLVQDQGAMPPNPALGLRGTRLLLRRPELFEVQLNAILRASATGPTRIMLPMVTNVGEVRASRDLLERCARRLRRRGVRLPERLPPLGIMIETPGAALSADALALEADFFAIGTNDLTMYTLAVDRADTELASLYDPLHPAVLRLVQYSTEAAMRLRRPVCICGEIASDPRMTPLLLGLGLRSFSMRAAGLPRVKQAVRSLRMDDCARFARRVLEETDPARVRAMVVDREPRV